MTGPPVLPEEPPAEWIEAMARAIDPRVWVVTQGVSSSRTGERNAATRQARAAYAALRNANLKEPI